MVNKKFKYQFNVLIWDYNIQVIEPYDVLPHFALAWKRCRKKKEYKTFEDTKKFLDTYNQNDTSYADKQKAKPIGFNKN